MRWSAAEFLTWACVPPSPPTHDVFHLDHPQDAIRAIRSRDPDNVEAVHDAALSHARLISKNHLMLKTLALIPLIMVRTPTRAYCAGVVCREACRTLSPFADVKLMLPCTCMCLCVPLEQHRVLGQV